MSHSTPQPGTRGRPPRLILALSLAALGGCDLDSLLEVDLPARVTDEALSVPASADVLIGTVISQFECGYSSFLYQESSFADTWDLLAGRHSSFEYPETPGDDTCDGSNVDFDWYMPVQISRSVAFETYDKLTEWTVEEVPNREPMLATSAIYAAASLNVLGEHFCEMAIDGSPLMTPDETLALAEQWVETALAHVATTGDFALAHGATGSIETMAYALRARIRWARGPDHWAGALQDALRVPQGYTAWVTRETGPQRRNKMYHAGTAIGYGHVHGPIRHWQGPPNPVTGASWPAVIPFTGYLDLGILPDGRAVSDDGYPIRTVDHAAAIADPRVQTRFQHIQGPEPGHVPVKYTSEDEDVPLVSWRELLLIRAEIEGGQAAIDRVNELRAARGLPLVTYANPNDADQIREMIIEERRRDLWLEGRFWSTKIQNTDKLWFPRNFGRSVFQGYGYEGGVSFLMPQSEYELNPNLDLSDRATGCSPARAPIVTD